MDGFRAEPGTIRAAASEVDTATEELTGAAREVSSARLAPNTLGGVAAAREFTDALTAFVEAHAADITRGADWAHATAEALISAADVYEQTDEHIGDVFTKLGRAL